MNPTLRSAFDKILAAQPERLPKPVRALLLAPPLHALRVVPDGEGFALARPSALTGTATRALVPKLGIKSWRDSGTLNLIHEGVPLAPALTKLLASPTPAQRRLAAAWLHTRTPLQVVLLPYHDLSQASELRFLVGPPQRVRLVSQCLRGESAAQLARQMPRLHDIARHLAAQLPPAPQLIDLACLPDGEVRLVEVNPGLTPAEVNAVMTQAG